MLIKSSPLLSAALLLTIANIALAAYPTSFQISDKAATASWNLSLTDYAIAPKTRLGTGETKTAFQIARINFIRQEPVASLAANRLFVPDLNGNLYIVDRATKNFNYSTPYINFATTFNGVGIGTFDNNPGFAAGLVTLQFDPDYTNNHLFYSVHTELDGAGSAFRQAVVTKWYDPNINNTTLDAGSTHTEMMRVQYTGNIHPVGDLVFNPLATNASHPDWRNMYIGSGDGGAGENGNATIRNQPQMLNNFLGKILRITPTDTNTGTYTIPGDNPFVSDTLYPGAKDEVYALGMRNPHRLSWDVDPNNSNPATNNILLVDNIGLNNYEELNIVHAGANYGYSKIEGTQVLAGIGSASMNNVNNDPLPTALPVWTTSASQNPAPAQQTLPPTYPVAQYSHQDGDAISSGFVYRGTRIPQLVGKYVFGDITTGRLFYVDLEDLKAVNDGQPVPVDMTKIHEMTIFYSSPFDSNGPLERRVFDIVHDAYDRRNETSQVVGSTTYSGADGDFLPGDADATAAGKRDPYNVLYGTNSIDGGRSDIRWALIDNELYLISKSDGLIRSFSTLLGGDADVNGVVDISDLSALANHWQQAGTWKTGDFDHNNIVNLSDLIILADNWQEHASPASLQDALASFGLPNVTVPEPVVAIPLIILLASARRPRRRAGAFAV